MNRKFKQICALTLLIATITTTSITPITAFAYDNENIAIVEPPIVKEPEQPVVEPPIVKKNETPLEKETPKTDDVHLCYYKEFTELYTSKKASFENLCMNISSFLAGGPIKSILGGLGLTTFTS